MSRRLALVFCAVLVLGVIDLVWYLVAVRPYLPAPPHESNRGRHGPAPQAIAYRPRATPPRAAQPTSTQPVTYHSSAPAADDLRKAVKGTNLVIVVMDATRADHVGCYGYPRDTTPNLDRLAQEGLLFEQHFCQFPQTTVSTASLFTGQYPDTHGLVDWTTSQDAHYQSIDPSTVTLEGALQVAGFETFFFSSNRCASPSLGVGGDFQHSQLVERRVEIPEYRPRGKGWAAPGAPMLIRAAAAGLAARKGSPLFLYLHFLPPHVPYEAPEEIVERYRGRQPPNYWHGEPAFTRVWEKWAGVEPPGKGADWVNIYDANLRWADQSLGNLIAELKQQGLWDNTLLIVTADHGESMGDHRYTWHASCPYDETIHIPLVIRFPGDQRPVGRVSALTETVDLMPTILDLYGVHSPETVQGKSLVPLLTGGTRQLHDYVFCKTGGNWACYVIRDHNTALFLYQTSDLRALFDLVKDPWQTHNLIAEEPARAAPLLRAFDGFAHTQLTPPLDFVDPNYQPPPKHALPTKPVSEETKRQLRALGYVK
jgi:arylsulfatase A-like enzyme